MIHDFALIVRALQEWNWTAFGTLVNVLTVIALAAITAWYARSAKRQADAAEAQASAAQAQASAALQTLHALRSHSGSS